MSTGGKEVQPRDPDPPASGAMRAMFYVAASDSEDPHVVSDVRIVQEAAREFAVAGLSRTPASGGVPRRR
ncbi:hypothetical protein GCM10011335_18330 [Aureimonas glaciei]|uniref:Uncharacterized protein n=1 Tax=Aureimonas glaciei TaxID=1776957 RepID=A0A917D8W3_9HYPH|nr:hypothetical protein GCM10011335_18330 [Aureimonas glaciei]